MKNFGSQNLELANQNLACYKLRRGNRMITKVDNRHIILYFNHFLSV